MALDATVVPADPPLDISLSAHQDADFDASPCLAVARPKAPSIISILKSAIGKHVQDPLILPVELSEPTTNLMRRAEEMEYAELLNQAAALPKESTERLLKVAAFALSPYSACPPERNGMSLFSMPGETLEVVLPRKGVRFIAENIYSNGWNIAYHAEGNDWTLSADDQPRPAIYANSTEFHMRWFSELVFKDGDIYTWPKAVTTANNIVSGTTFISHHGQLRIAQKSTGREAVILFKDIPTLTFGAQARKAANATVEGHVVEKGQKVDGLQLKGLWGSHLDLLRPGHEKELLWKANKSLEVTNSFHITDFAIKLSLLTDSHKGAHATDSRRRKDLELMRLGAWKEAHTAKTVVEKKGFQQVVAARELAENAIAACWFKPVGDSLPEPGSGIRFRYTGQYWGRKGSEEPSTKFFLDN